MTVTRGPVQFWSLGFDDVLVYEPQTGAKKKSVLVPGTISVNAVSRVPLECERIAWWIAEELWANRDLLLQAGFFDIGRTPQILSPSPAGSLVAGDMADEYVVTTVTCPFQFVRTTKVTPLGRPVLQGVGAQLHGVLPPAGSLGPVDRFEVETHAPPHYSGASDIYGATPSPGSAPPSLPTVPHPLNPAVRVYIRPVRPNQPGLLPPSMNGRAIPIRQSPMPESPPVRTPDQRIKV
ncbi:hypothetical protein LVJ94_34935 [Pendulispora rubella]|uniref:Uncharacterized protein n=1 Tax=Pendulispora rubella TaxID=2741070 RepID=A0ABZ2L0H6_9BACT